MSILVRQLFTFVIFIYITYMYMLLYCRMVNVSKTYMNVVCVSVCVCELCNMR